MRSQRADFHRSEFDQPHPERRRAILKVHPEVKQLYGRNPWTMAVLLLVLLLQVAGALWMGRAGLHYWWASLILAWFVGAFASHAMYVIIHEATHNLIFANQSWNRWAAICADLPNTFPAAMGFKVYHLKHHAHQGDYDSDADLASRWEARLIGNSFIGKMLWEMLFPLFQLLRPPRLKAIRMWSGWSWTNLICVLAFDIAIFCFCGANGSLYLFASFFFSVGFHPLGARWIQEHYTHDPVQETFSYYGPLNLLALNVGYHNEHHDFPCIPWNNLPRLKAAAPEYYECLKAHKSWTLLWLQFLCDKRYSLFARVERTERGKAGVSDPPVRTVTRLPAG
jgi:sphingolipid 4-desaturase/C4-monooxygenase